jgi:hypothetical protein
MVLVKIESLARLLARVVQQLPWAAVHAETEMLKQILVAPALAMQHGWNQNCLLHCVVAGGKRSLGLLMGIMQPTGAKHDCVPNILTRGGG